MKDEQRARRYYDAFSLSYEQGRDRGYHALIDDLEVELARRYMGPSLLEAGCGTGLILGRLAQHCARAVGVDLSAGMLAQARRRGLNVIQGSLDHLPFADNSFDLVVSFKVLAHVPPIREALAELVRVTRPGGHLLLEFYNQFSLRGLVKRCKGPCPVSETFNDHDVFTRLDTPLQMMRYLPENVAVLGVRGVRIFTPFALLHKIPIIRDILAQGERRAADLPFLRWLGGFIILILEKDSPAGS